MIQWRIREITCAGEYKKHSSISTQVGEFQEFI